MDKRNLKKAEQTKTEKKDRGDNPKKVEKTAKKPFNSANDDVKVPHPDRGDSERKLPLLDKAQATFNNKSVNFKNKVIEHRSKDIFKKKDEKSDPKAENGKPTKKAILNSVENVKFTNLDFESNLPKSDKAKPTVRADVVKKVVQHSKENLAKNIVKSDAEAVNRSERVERRKIREKHSLQPKTLPSVTPNIAEKEEIAKINVKIPSVDNKNATERITKKPSELKGQNENVINSSASILMKSEPNGDSTLRRPIIKTVTAKINDNTKVFKAVTFVEQRNKPTPLQIKIPNELKHFKTSKTSENTVIKRVNTTVSRVSIKEKIHPKKKREKKRRHVTSPDLPVRVCSPQTEVAKWAPSCINRHTKPYYEAWVNTTLAAISKNSRKDRLFLEKQNLLQNFQRVLAERPETPELVYENFKDERYTGRIKVKQR